MKSFYRIIPIKRSFFSRTYEVLSPDGSKLAQITQSASDYDTIVTSEGAKYLVGGDININLWMECPDGTVYEVKRPDGFQIGYNYFIEFDGREIKLEIGFVKNNDSIFENGELIGKIKKEPRKWPEGFIHKIKALFSLRQWTLEIKNDIPEQIAFFIIWIVLTVDLKLQHGEGRELKTLTLEKERKRLKKINIKESGKVDKLTKAIKILAWMWFITATIPGVILGIKLSFIVLKKISGIYEIPHTLDALTSLMLIPFLISNILFAPPLILLLVIKSIVLRMKERH
ncbi:hypothetical protein [Thermodesulfobacterium thermophilum]|uniref:hypothetical protein n=1 Tax=Thermodesulfobacterium thermophilum TaxID=886 RepID=UPI0003B3DCE6|nr:hypothetical protein [Thermodesulfobacterium thermophilum]